MKYFILTLLSIVFLCQLGTEINTATATVVDLASPSGTAVTGTVHKNFYSDLRMEGGLMYFVIIVPSNARVAQMVSKPI